WRAWSRRSWCRSGRCPRSRTRRCSRAEESVMHLRHLALVAGAAVLAACTSGTAADYPTKGPEALYGIWVPDAAPEELRTVDGKAPPLTAEAAEVHKARLARYKAGDTSFDQTTWCASPGMPRVLTMPYPFEIRADGDYLAFIHGWYRTHRVVDMKGEPVDPPLPLTMGFANGRWEGDTLVIRTTGLIDVTTLDASGLPRSEEMVLTERLRVLPDGRLEDRITIEDPATFTGPWETVLYFQRDTAARVTDDVCRDRIAAGEPAVRKELPAESAASAEPAPSAPPAAAAPATPRLGGMWEPRTFGFMVPEAPLSAAGRAVVDRNA